MECRHKPGIGWHKLITAWPVKAKGPGNPDPFLQL
jgi:hypothetical protein